MVDFPFPGFNRRYVLIPMLIAVALVAASYVITEERRSYTTALAVGVHEQQERLRELAELIYAVADAESAQRGFLLTLDPDYLAPFENAKKRADTTLADLLRQYKDRDADELHYLQDAKKRIDGKFEEMQATIALAEANHAGGVGALQLVKTDIGLYWMNDIRDIFEAIRSRERNRVYADIGFWETQVKINRYIAIAAAILNVILLLIIGVLITWEIERRNLAAMKLNAIVEERTAELTELSEHMLRVREHEKLHLARELHDELGGLLVAMKMDLAQLAKKFDFTQPDIQVRWQRIQSALTSGVALKRRVIEELRPTLLDNLGLVAAMRWQCEETCSQANIALTMEFPAEEIKVDTNIAIAIFRVAQETLTNTVKHARATKVNVNLKTTHEQLTLIIEDNGVGLPPTLVKISGSHGLLGMKYRMQAIGGTFQIVPAVPNGTKVIVKLALELANAMAELE